MRANKIRLVQGSSKAPKKAIDAQQLISFIPNTAPVNKIHKNSKILKVSGYITKSSLCKRSF